MRRDYYMEKAQSAADPIIRKAMERMVDAARAAFNAKGWLDDAMHKLERHPDYIRTERAMKGSGSRGVTPYSLAWFAHSCVSSALHDAPIEDVGDWLLADADPRRCATTLRQFIEEDRRSTEAARKKARAARLKGKRPALQIVQATA